MLITLIFSRFFLVLISLIWVYCLCEFRVIYFIRGIVSAILAFQALGAHGFYCSYTVF